jgi:hypothetical protein
MKRCVLCGKGGAVYEFQALESFLHKWQQNLRYATVRFFFFQY